MRDQTPHSRAAYYWALADEAENYAAAGQSEDIREGYLKLARGWRALADEALKEFKLNLTAAAGEEICKLTPTDSLPGGANAILRGGNTTWKTPS